MIIGITFVVLTSAIVILAHFLGKSVKADPQWQAHQLAKEASSSSDPSSRPKKLSVKERIGCASSVIVTTAVVITLPILLVNHCVDQHKKAELVRKQEEAAKAAEQAAEDAENKRKGFHCLNIWDGSDDDVVAGVKDRLRDPGNFEHIETRISPVNAKGRHLLMMRFRSRNGFGGMVEGFATADIRNSDCKVLSLRLVE